MFAFFRALKLIWQNRELLIKFLETLPAALGFAGDGLKQAGQGAVTASYFIRGGGNAPINARDLIATAADAIEQSKSQVDHAANLIDDAGQEIGKIKVPTIEFTSIDTPFGKVVSGITVGETSLFGLVEQALCDGAEKLHDFGNQLGDTSDKLNEFSEALDTSGGNIRTTGNFLISSGQKLKEVSE